MRYKAALISLLIISSCALGFGQDSITLRDFGKFTRVQQWDGRTDEHVLLQYKARGVVFLLYDGGGDVLRANVSAPSRPASTRPSCGINDLIPGVGAYGVTLGMSRQQVKRSPFATRAKLEAIEPDGMFFTAGDRELAVCFVNGRVSMMNVFGPFRTPEGITKASGVRQIERAYGRADQYYQAPHRNYELLFLLSLILPAIGLVVGLGLGLVTRRMVRPEAGNRALVGAMLVGAVALAAYSFSFQHAFVHALNSSASWRLQLAKTASAAFTGAVCVLMMKLITNRMPGCLGALVIFFAMLLVSSLIGTFTMGTGPVDFTARGLLVHGVLFAPFILGLALTGRPTRRADGLNRHAELVSESRG